MNIEFYEENGEIRADLFDSDAKKIAESLVTATKDKWGNPVSDGVSRHQLRRIFDEVKRLQKTYEEKGDWGKTYPMVKLLKSKIAYTVARMKGNNNWSLHDNYYNNLEDFITSGINRIQKPEDLKTFTLLFEAVYGFYYNLGGAQTK